MISPSVTTSRFSLAISSPITLLPGITSTTRTESTDSARARSLASAVIWLAFTPGAGRSSKRVTTGPGCTATTSASMVKSLSFISTRRESASSASAEYSGSRGGGSSSSFSGGSSLAAGGSNSGTCRSRSTRALFSGTGAGASIRGGARARDFFCRLSTASLRAWRRSRPSAASREELERARSQPMPAQVAAPRRSMIVNHDTPKASDRPAIQAAIISSVAPRKSSPAASPPPTTLPTTPPALWRSTPGCQWSVVSAQLATSTSRKPAMRTSALAREALTACSRRCRPQQAAASTSGKRNAGRPKRKKSTSASQAPMTPMRLCTPEALPVKENPGSSGL